MERVSPVRILGAGQCPNCTTNMNVIESEVNEITLDANGLPYNYDNMMFKSVLYCPNCKKSYPCVKRGLGFEISDPLVEKLININKIEKINKLNTNPFGI